MKVLLILTALLLLSCSCSKKEEELPQVHTVDVEVPQIVKEKCIMCHDVVKRKVGPSFIQVRDKYKKDPDAIKKIARSIKEGSEGKWGRIPMMPNDVTEKEALYIADWIMSIK